MRSRRGPVLTAAAVLLVSVLATPSVAGASGFDGDPGTTERIDQSDANLAAIATSQARFGADGAAHAVLSRDDVFADALAGAPLTADGPMLFTASAALAAPVRAEIERVLPPNGRVYLLGGPNALAPAIESELRAAGHDVVRLAGTDRIKTSIQVAREVRRLGGQGAGQTVALARAWGPANNPTAAWADSVTGGAWAAHAGVPIVHTQTEVLSGDTAAFLREAAPSTTVLFGGPAALSAAVEQSVPNPWRIHGPDRFATAAEITSRLWGPAYTSGARRYVVLHGYREDGWRFGLAAAGISADADAPALLVHPDQVPPETMDLASSCGTPQVDLLLMGSASVISSSHQTTLDAGDGRNCGTTSCPDDFWEENDQQSRAAAVQPDTPYEELRLCPGDADWFGIDLEIGEVVRVDGFYTGTQAPTVYLYNPDGTLAKIGGAADGQLALEATAFTLGRFGLRFASDDATDYEFLFTVTTPSTCDEDRYAPNHQPSQAHDLGWADATHDGLVLCPDEPDDWFRINTSAGDRVSIQAIFQHAEGDIDLYVQDAGGQELARGDSVEDNEGVTFFSDGGDLYVHVGLVRDDGEPGSTYDLGVGIDHALCSPDDDLEENDTTGAWIVPARYHGLMACRDDPDWMVYEVGDSNTASDHTITVYAPSAEGDLQLTVRSDDGTVLEQAETDGGGGASVTYSEGFRHQRFWVRVDLVADRGEPGIPYDLEFDVGGGPHNICPPQDYAPDNDASSGAVRLTQSTTGIFEVVCAGDDDWYRVWAQLGQTISLVLDASMLAADLDLELLDPTGAFLRGASTSSGDETIVVDANMTGFFTFRVYLYETTGGPSEAYALDVRVT